MIAQGAIYTAGTIAQLLGFVVFLPVLTRQYPAEEFGVIVTGLLVTQLLALLCALGLPIAIGREFYRVDDGPERSRRLLAALVPISVVITGLAALTGPLWAKVFSSTEFDSLHLLAVATAAPRALSLGAQSFFRAAQQPGAFVATGIGSSLGTQATGLAIAAATQGDPVAFFAGIFGAQCVVALGSHLAIGPLFGRRLGRLVRQVREVTHYALPSILHAGAGVLIVSGDRILIERKIGLEAVGQYQVLYVGATLGLLTTASLNQAWGPQILQRASEVRWSVLRASSRHFLYIAGGLAAGAALLTPLALPFAAPYELPDLFAVTAIVSIATVGWAHYLSRSQVLFVERETRHLMVITPLAALLNIGLNLVLIDRFALLGAAISTLVAYGFWGLASQASSIRVADMAWPARPVVAAYLLAATGAGVSVLLPGEGAVDAGVRVALSVLLGAWIVHCLLRFGDSVKPDVAGVDGAQSGEPSGTQLGEPGDFDELRPVA